MKFTEYHLSEELQKGIEKLGFRRPTDIQYKSIPNILKGLLAKLDEHNLDHISEAIALDFKTL